MEKNKQDGDIQQVQNQNQTQALQLAKQGIIPPKKFNHDPNIKDDNNNTVEQYLKEYKLPIPNHWITDKSKQKNKIWFQQAIYNEKIVNKNIKPNEQNIDGFTIAMIQAINGQIPEKQYQHNPNIKNIYGMSVEDIMKQQGIEVPNEWKCVKDDEHDKYMENYDNPKKDENGQTQAMKLAIQGIIPDKQYQHNPSIQDNDGHTVAIYLANKGIIPPKQRCRNSAKNSKNKQTNNTLYLSNSYYQLVQTSFPTIFSFPFFSYFASQYFFK